MKIKKLFKSKALTVIGGLMIALAVTVFTPTDAKAAQMITQTGASYNSITIRWEPILGEKYYVSQLSTDRQNWVIEETRYYGYSQTFYNLQEGKTYYVRVRPKNSDSWYEPIEVTTACGGISGLKQTSATTNSISISWNKQPGATSYQVCKWQNSQEYVVGETTNNWYTIGGFSNTTDIPCDIYVKPIRKINTGFEAGKEPSEYLWNNGYISSYNLTLIPAKMSKPQVTTYYTHLNQVWVDFVKPSFASGIQYEMYNSSGKLMYRKTRTSNYDTCPNIKMGNFYKIRVRAYTSLNGKILYGQWSDYTDIGTSPSLKIKKKGSGFKISWKKVSSAKSYTVYGSTKQNGKYKKIATTKKKYVNVKKIGKKKIKNNKYYYFYVIANKKDGTRTNKKTVYYAKRR